MTFKGSVYLVQPAELIGTNRYKLGCSKKGNLDRCKNGYKNGTRYIIIMECENPHNIETQIKQKFNIYFELVAGKEYFEGEIKDMIKVFYETVYNNIFKYNELDFKFDLDNNNLSNQLIKKENLIEEKTLIYVEDNHTIYQPKPKSPPMSGAIRTKKYYEKHKEKILLKKKLQRDLKKKERQEILDLD
jgi:hypothetical protein